VDVFRLVKRSRGRNLGGYIGRVQKTVVVEAFRDFFRGHFPFFASTVSGLEQKVHGAFVDAIAGFRRCLLDTLGSRWRVTAGLDFLNVDGPKVRGASAVGVRVYAGRHSHSIRCCQSSERSRNGYGEGGTIGFVV